MYKLFKQLKICSKSLFLRREIALRMHEKLDLIKLKPKNILDAGCGEGFDIFLLKKRFINSNIIGLDKSIQMLKLSKKNIINNSILKKLPYHSFFIKNFLKKFFDIYLVTGNFLKSPFYSNIFNIIWCNLAIFWNPQLKKIFYEWFRLTKNNGLIIFSCFGLSTLKELNSIILKTKLKSNISPLLPLMDMHNLGNILIDIGFIDPIIDIEKITITYTSPEKMLKDIQSLGGNLFKIYNKNFFEKKFYHKMIKKLLIKYLNINKKISLTYEIIFIHAFKPKKIKK
ncbi:malonyl-[acyl-carrier protein] O-methyltransferase [Candidatus Profftella armatura (Diaphorina cf. continua)]|uniref:Malonyl-[acyl-carrier protein] O-methyltransferase n=1 Tax=Candidatus Profftella armatura (Diaphorina cf. continua) TaxID=2661583 RepID=A0A7R7AC90_9PROT|nr:methyltransferase domain-containing protein [Candidatus Profftella armatura (Diaphorina cf. continua)]BCG49575.1 malonyl-[acyl-carrier protein] O-methyltransferase [Candidatus Profftella armatura (Diaphorina cf. continua)]